MKYEAKIGDEVREFEFKWDDGLLIARSGDRVAALDVSQVGNGEALSLLVDGQSFDIVTDVQGQDVTVQLRGERYQAHVVDERERAAAEVAGNKVGGKRELRAAMPGVVVDVKVAVGDQVEEGQTLVVLEAMKMQNPLGSEGAGTVTKVVIEPGDAVAAGALLVEIE